MSDLTAHQLADKVRTALPYNFAGHIEAFAALDVLRDLAAERESLAAENTRLRQAMQADRVDAYRRGYLDGEHAVIPTSIRAMIDKEDA